MKNKIYLVSSVIVFLAAGFLMSFAIWAFTQCNDIISQARASGQIAASGNEYDIINFYMGSCGQYFIYTLLLVAAGLLLLNGQSSQMYVPAGNVKNNMNDEELDEWFDGLDKQDK